MSIIKCRSNMLKKRDLRVHFSRTKMLFLSRLGAKRLIPLLAREPPWYLQFSTTAEQPQQQQEQEQQEQQRWIVPRKLLDVRFSRSPGAGGQNVNKVSTKADARLSLSIAKQHLPPQVFKRLQEQQAHRISKEGELIFTSSDTRSQAMNLNDCIAKMQRVIDEAFVEPKERVVRDATEFSEREMAMKKREKMLRSAKKQQRQRGSDDY